MDLTKIDNIEDIKLILSYGYDVNLIDMYDIVDRNDTITAEYLLSHGFEPSGDLLECAYDSYTLRNHDLSMIKILLSHGADVNIVRRCSLLWAAATSGYAGLVNLCLEYGADINSRDEVLHRTPLVACVCIGETDIAKLLIDRGADISIVDCNGHDALFYALESDNTELFNLLIKNKAGLSRVRLNNVIKIHSIKDLLDLGVDIDEVDITGMSLLLYAYSECKDMSTVNLLLQRGANPNNGRHKILNAAVVYNNVDMFFLLIQHGANINERDENGEDPLRTLLCTSYNEIMFKYLLEHGADVNSPDENGLTPLMIALMNRLPKDMVISLIKYGADVNAVDCENETPLFYAIYNEYDVELITMILENNADVNAVCCMGISALQKALPDISIIKLLLSYGCSVNTFDIYGYSPICSAAEKGLLDACSLFIQHGSHINTPNVFGHTPLHAAVMSDCVELVTLLIDNNADVFSFDESNKLPIYYTRCVETTRILVINMILVSIRTH